jgi:O-antigen/teichoic acid export membrane protein
VNANEIQRQTALRDAPCPAEPEAKSREAHLAAPQVQPAPDLPRGLSLRSNFAWALTGNVVYAACQWGMIVALAKLGSTLMVGQFSLGLAIATPVLMFSNLHLRAVQATDANRVYRFSDYLQLRVTMTLAAMGVIAGIVWFGRYEPRTTLVILAVALAKAIEGLSDIHYGLFQLNDRLDHTGLSMMLRGAAAVIALSVALCLTRNVVWGCLGVAAAWLGALLFFDVRRGRRLLAHADKTRTGPGRGLRRQWRLIYLALPLGLVTTIASINLNMPRYYIQSRMGEHALGIFSAMAYATVAMTLVSDSLANCAIPSMSRMYANGQRAEFRRLLFRLLAAGTALGLAGLAIAQFGGARLLAIVYSAEYANQSRVFVVLMLAAALHFVASMLTCGITSARCFGIQVPIFALVAASNALACARWVPGAGLLGGAMAVAAGAVVRLVLSAVVLGYLLWSPARNVLGSVANWETGL